MSHTYDAEQFRLPTGGDPGVDLDGLLPTGIASDTDTLDSLLRTYGGFEIRAQDTEGITKAIQAIDAAYRTVLTPARRDVFGNEQAVQPIRMELVDLSREAVEEAYRATTPAGYQVRVSPPATEAVAQPVAAATRTLSWHDVGSRFITALSPRAAAVLQTAHKTLRETSDTITDNIGNGFSAVAEAWSQGSRAGHDQAAQETRQLVLPALGNAGALYVRLLAETWTRPASPQPAHEQRDNLRSAARAILTNPFSSGTRSICKAIVTNARHDLQDAALRTRSTLVLSASLAVAAIINTVEAVDDWARVSAAFAGGVDHAHRNSTPIERLVAGFGGIWGATSLLAGEVITAARDATGPVAGNLPSRLLELGIRGGNYTIDTLAKHYTMSRQAQFGLVRSEAEGPTENDSDEPITGALVLAGPQPTAHLEPPLVVAAEAAGGELGNALHTAVVAAAVPKEPLHDTREAPDRTAPITVPLRAAPVTAPLPILEAVDGGSSSPSTGTEESLPDTTDARVRHAPTTVPLTKGSVTRPLLIQETADEDPSSLMANTQAPAHTEAVPAVEAVTDQRRDGISALLQREHPYQHALAHRLAGIALRPIIDDVQHQLPNGSDSELAAAAAGRIDAAVRQLAAQAARLGFTEQPPRPNPGVATQPRRVDTADHEPSATSHFDARVAGTLWHIGSQAQNVYAKAYAQLGAQGMKQVVANAIIDADKRGFRSDEGIAFVIDRLKGSGGSPVAQTPQATPPMPITMPPAVAVSPTGIREHLPDLTYVPTIPLATPRTPSHGITTGASTVAPASRAASTSGSPGWRMRPRPAHEIYADIAQGNIELARLLAPYSVQQVLALRKEAEGFEIDLQDSYRNEYQAVLESGVEPWRIIMATLLTRGMPENGPTFAGEIADCIRSQLAADAAASHQSPVQQHIEDTSWLTDDAPGPFGAAAARKRPSKTGRRPATLVNRPGGIGWASNGQVVRAAS